MTDTIAVSVENVSLSFSDRRRRTHAALDDVTLDVREHEFVSVVGPSGSGKSSLLNLIAGLLQPTTGSITYGRPLRELHLGFVFQASTLFPWRTVKQNLIYSLEIAGATREDRNRRANAVSTLVGLDPAIYLQRFPNEISGGEARRVALGAAIARQPELLLLDEPTSQLDYFSRREISAVVQTLWLKQRFTTVHVTHDIDEAIQLSDRVVCLARGRVQEILSVDLPRPRTATHVSTREFGEYRSRMLRAVGGAAL
jgi:NitT/TauT family transport system ATP-binding protein